MLLTTRCFPSVTAELEASVQMMQLVLDRCRVPADVIEKQADQRRSFK